MVEPRGLQLRVIGICLASGAALAEGACVLPEVRSADVQEDAARMPSSAVEPATSEEASASDQHTTMQQSVDATQSASQPQMPSADSPQQAQHAGTPADGGMSPATLAAPAIGDPCGEPSTAYCLEPGTKQLLRCDGERWATALCDVALDWSCDHTTGSIDNLCVFDTPTECAGVAAGGRTCLGQYVHACEDSLHSRRVEFCGGDLGTCRNGSCGCGASVCAQRIATLPASYARNLVRSTSYLFWIDDSAHRVGRVSIDGTGQTTIASASGALGALVADGSAVFWTEVESGRVVRGGLDGSGATPIATGQAKPRGLALDDTAVYWVNQGDSGSLFKASKAGGTSAALVTNGGVSSLLVLDGFVYFDYRLEVQRIPVGGGAVSSVTTLQDGEEASKLLSASTTHLYLAASRSSLGFIARVPLQGGELTELPIPSVASDLVVDAQHVYYGANVSDVMQCEFDGTNPTLVFHSLNGPVHGIALDDTSVYFSAGDAIYKIPK